MDIFYELNNRTAELIGITFFDPKQLVSLVIRFIINFAVVAVIARYFYFPKSNRRDYMFVFIIMSISIFMLVTLMEGDVMNTGAALSLFAIFGIIRYRTEAVPIREMTYLFMLVAVSVVNAMGRAEYHPKNDYWSGIGLVTIVFANLIFILLAYLFESSKLVSSNCSKYIKYDNVALIAPDRRDELKADLEKRTGLKILKVEVGTIDFLKDCCLIRIYYDEPKDRGNSIEQISRMPQ
ncbi:MAG TPA: DUF4956 domain-containing protein [Prevotellaceae bacterium]|nr:DUF4956 domain-containing protein [Prevotellaceae bacterium]HBE55597.1 DUF4956 domain-containing protein [Prevotellaceae bacterium]